MILFLLSTLAAAPAESPSDPRPPPPVEAASALSLLARIAPDLTRWLDEAEARVHGAVDATRATVRSMVQDLIGYAAEGEGITGTLRGQSACDATGDDVLLPRPGAVRVGVVGDATIRGAVRRAWLQQEPPCGGEEGHCAKIPLKRAPEDARENTTLTLPALADGAWTLHLKLKDGARRCVPFESQSRDLQEERELEGLPVKPRLVWLGGKHRLWEVQALARQIGPEDQEARHLVGLVACAWGLSPEELGVAGESCLIWRQQ